MIACLLDFCCNNSDEFWLSAMRSSLFNQPEACLVCSTYLLHIFINLLLAISFQADVHNIGVLRHLKVQKQQRQCSTPAQPMVWVWRWDYMFLTKERWFLKKKKKKNITNKEMLNIKEQVTHFFIKISAAIDWYLFSLPDFVTLLFWSFQR